MYQSNETLNEELHHQAKRAIAEVLVEFPIHEMHSYIHGNIIFSIGTNNPVSSFDDIVEALEIPLAINTPPLHFSLTLVSRTSKNQNIMYIDGLDDLDTHFLDSISDIFTPPE